MRSEENGTLNESDLFGDTNSDLMSNLKKITDWKKTHGKGNEGPFLVLYDSKMPIGIKQAVNRLNAFTYDNLPMDEIGFSTELFESLENLDDYISIEDSDSDEDEEPIQLDNFPLALSSAICDLDEREYKIFNERFLMEEPRSFEAIGGDLGVTRERIRQIEKNLRDRMQPVFDEFSIDEKLSSLFTNDKKFIRSSRLNTVFPEFEKYLPNSTTPVKWVLRNYCRFTYEEKDGWLATPSILEAKRLFKDRLGKQASQHGVFDKDALLAFKTYDDELADIIDWAKYCGITFYKDHLILCSNIGEYAEAILEIENQPMPTEELQAIVDPNTSAKGFRQKLYKSRSAIRTDVRMWGLRDWGLDEYNSIEQTITDMLNAHDGSMQYDALIDELLDRYSFSKSSLWAKLNEGPFSVRENVVFLERSSNGAKSSVDPYSAAKLFRLDKGWAFRFTVTQRLKDGSGFYATKAIANILHLKPGDVKHLSSPIGLQRIAWTSSVITIGTIRRFIVEGVVNVGQEAFCLFNDDESFSIIPMRTVGKSDIRDALALACLPATGDVDLARHYLASAIGLPSNATFRDLIQKYKERGDSDISQCLATYSE